MLRKIGLHHNAVVSLFVAAIFTVSFADDESDKMLESVKDHPSWSFLDPGDEVECGESHSDRIIGGKNAALGQYPWLARLGYKDEGEDEIEYKCGGSLLNKHYVLTAAHCVTPLRPITIRLGEYDVRTPIDCSNGVCAEKPQEIAIDTITTHETYDKPKYANDIALIRLAKEVDYNGWVGPICLPKHGVKLDHNGTAETAGWGVTDMDTLDVADVLQTLTVPIVQIDKCQTFYKSVTKLKETQICAGGIRDKDACGGDSGGPLMQVHMGEEAPQYFLMGVVSFGPAMCGGAPPGVFTHTAHYIKWILDNIKSA